MNKRAVLLAMWYALQFLVVLLVVTVDTIKLWGIREQDIAITFGILGFCFLCDLIAESLKKIVKAL